MRFSLSGKNGFDPLLIGSYLRFYESVVGAGQGPRFGGAFIALYWS